MPPRANPIIVRLDQHISPSPIFSPDFEHTYIAHSNISHESENVTRLLLDAGASVVITTRVPISRETIEKCASKGLGLERRLALVAVFAIGFDMVDLEACKEFGVEVRNVKGASVEAVAEHVLGFYFGLRRRVITMHNLLTQTNGWVEKGILTSHFKGLPLTLKQETIGIIGVGQLGTRVSTLFSALGSKVLLSERPSSTTIRPGRTSFLETLSKSTVLVLCLSLTPETKNLISTEEIKLLSPGAIIINVARGEVIDEVALIEALKEERISGAATDVFVTEPTGKESSLLVREAPGLEGRLIVSPHVAWYAESSIEKLRRVTGENIEGWFRGEKGGENFIC